MLSGGGSPGRQRSFSGGGGGGSGKRPSGSGASWLTTAAAEAAAKAEAEAQRLSAMSTVTHSSFSFRVEGAEEDEDDKVPEGTSTHAAGGEAPEEAEDDDLGAAATLAADFVRQPSFQSSPRVPEHAMAATVELSERPEDLRHGEPQTEGGGFAYDTSYLYHAPVGRARARLLRDDVDIDDGGAEQSFRAVVRVVG